MGQAHKSGVETCVRADTAVETGSLRVVENDADCNDIESAFGKSENDNLRNRQL